MHAYGQCPACNKTCKKCQRKNHFSSVCRSKSVKEIVADNSSCDESESDDDESEIFIASITVNKDLTHETISAENTFDFEDSIQ